MNILVTGGAGYIGSHVCKHLSLNGFNPITVDNLSRGNIWAVKWGPLEVVDLLDISLLKKIFYKYKPIAIIHFAGLSYVGESVNNPYLYYHNNVFGTLNLLNAIDSTSATNKILFSSSCATYGIPKNIPIQENDYQKPINPYGSSKLVIERILKEYNNACNINSISLRYFNATGADSEGIIGEVHDPEPHLIPSLLNYVIGKRPNIDIYGNDYNTRDGFCIRDYVHVEDLATAHILALKKLLKCKNVVANYNLGNGFGYSVLEVIKTVEQVTGKKIRYDIMQRRNGDPAELIAKVDNARKILNWKPSKPNLFDQVTDSWNWHKSFFK